MSGKYLKFRFDFFFWEKKTYLNKTQIQIWIFFSEKKSKFEGEKKPRKKFSKVKFGFFHMDGPNMKIFGETVIVN